MVLRGLVLSSDLWCVTRVVLWGVGFFLLLLFEFGGVLCMCFSYKKGKPNASFFL